MLARSLGQVLKDKLLAVGLAALLLGQLLYFADFGGLFAVALVFLIAVGLPYPAIINSLFARFVAAILLAFSFIQLAAVAQFLLLPESDFKTLSLLTSSLAVVAVLVLHRFKTKIPVVSKVDLGAATTASIFAISLGLIIFWGNNPSSLTAFGARQSQDGSAHQVALSEMGGSQHFTYKTNSTYYPKGFHIASALFLDAFNLHQKEQSWLTNAKVYVWQYIIWGSLLAFVLYYICRWLAGKFMEDINISSEILLAFIIGPSLSLFYLIPFAHQGFLNFYYICAALVISLLFLPGFKLKTPADRWLVLAFFVLAFGVTMSWGPILLPVACLIPALYLLADNPTFKAFFKKIFSKDYIVVWIGLLILLIPLLIHLVFAKENAFNAYGSIRDFNYAILLAGLGMCGILLFKNSNNASKDFAANALLPLFLLVGLLVAAQYFTAGEIRYYSIKTSYALEIILIACGGALFFCALSKLNKLRQWLVGPLLFGMLVFLLIAVNANPLQSLRNMFATPNHFETDVQKITSLGLEGELRVSNNTILHYISDENKISANPLIGNWANGLANINEGNPESAACGSKMFTIFAYGSGSAEEQRELVAAIKTCIDNRVGQGKPYYIITDSQSRAELIKIFGDKATFL